jgi:hypothetical protein
LSIGLLWKHPANTAQYPEDSSDLRKQNLWKHRNFLFGIQRNNMRWKSILLLCGAVLFPFSAYSQQAAIQEIPPAMNLLSEIPIQANNASPAQPSPNQRSSNQPSHSKADTQQPPSIETFTGTISKSGDGYFLKDAHGTLYRLDDAQRAAPYENKPVEITGQLELDTNLIHVASIQPTH